MRAWCSRSGGGLRVEDDFLIGEGPSEKLCSYLDDFRRV
jgi:hypothetical protein